MKIGIFGGSFNPIHKMHEKLCLELMKKYKLDKIIFVPTGDGYDKRNLIDAKHRYEMVRIVVNKHQNFSLSDYEIRNGNKYTYQSLLHFKKRYSMDEIYFIMGADNLVDLENWKEKETILSNYKLLVVSRSNIKLSDVLTKYSKYKDNIIISDVEENTISSTFIRKHLHDENYSKISDYLDDDVLDYIKKNRLYL